MQVREVGPQDVEGWVAVFSAVAHERRWIGTEPPVEREVWVPRVTESVRSPEHVLRLVEDDGQVVGTGGLHPGSTGGVWQLGMALLPRARGRGAGGQLLDALLVAARDGLHHKVELMVWPHNARALALYVSRGFAVEGVRRRHYRRADGSLWDGIEMGLLLPG